jgi:hypothetical protein
LVTGLVLVQSVSLLGELVHSQKQFFLKLVSETRRVVLLEQHLVSGKLLSIRLERSRFDLIFDGIKPVHIFQVGGFVDKHIEKIVNSVPFGGEFLDWYGGHAVFNFLMVG